MCFIHFRVDRRTIHLSYHDNEHYCSVRNLADADGPPTPIHIDEDWCVASSAAPAVPLTRNEQIVMDSTGCRNLSVIREALVDNAADVDATVEYLVQMRAIGQDQEWEPAPAGDAVDASASAAPSNASGREPAAHEQHVVVPKSKSPSRGSASASGAAVSAPAASSSSLDTLERLQAMLDSADPNKACPACSSARAFRVCCMRKAQSSVQQLRSSSRALDELQSAEAAAATAAAAHAPPRLSNKERKEQQRLEQEAAADGASSGARRKPKSKHDAADAGSDSRGGNAAAMRVVGI